MKLPTQNITTFSTFCSNPKCNEPFNLDKARAEIHKSGIIYADCGEVIFQGYKCTNQNCQGLRFFKCDRNDPVFDLRDFIMIPNLNIFADSFEKLLVQKNANNGHDFLKFNFLSARNGDVSDQGLPDDYARAMYDNCCMMPEEYEFEAPEDCNPKMTSQITEHQRSTMGIPYLMTTDQFERRLKKEFETGVIQLRRLYPYIPKFKNLMACLAQNKITKRDEIDGVVISWAEGDSAEEIQEKNAVWRALLEECGGRSLTEAIIGLLKDKGITNLDENEVEKLINQKLFFLHSRVSI